jgi:UDP-glucose 4-epimerase
VPGSILLVGRHSFLAQHALGALDPAEVRAVGYAEIGRPDLLDGIGCVVNFCRDPIVDQSGKCGTDFRLADRIGDRDIAYVMLSTRKVYTPRVAPLSENSPTGPIDPYGRHKLATEAALRARLGERLTVLRLANVFGYERAAGRRTFVALLLDRLAREGRIHYTISPFVERDFLPVEAFARLLASVVRAPPGGIINVGSGIGLPAGRVALWILEGLGRGELVIESTVETDGFVLDITRLEGLYGRPCSLADLRNACLAIGRRLAADLAQASR